MVREGGSLVQTLLVRSGMRFDLRLISFLCLVGCSSSATSTSAPTAAADDKTAGSDAGTTPVLPALPPCPDGTKESGERCETKLSIARSTQELAPARDHHTTHVFEVGGTPFLYVFGGTPSWATIYDDVQRAKINPDGSLDAFESMGKMPRKRAGHWTVRIKDKIVVIAGSTMGASATSMTIGETTSVATIGADGSIGDWTDGPPLAEGVMHHTALVRGDYLFVFGGRGDDTGASVKTVSRAKIGPDGIPGAFETVTPLPEARSHHMMFEYGDWVYLAGGLTGDPLDNPPSRADIIRARIDASGELGAWEAAGSFPKGGLSVSSAEVFGRNVYFFGGLPTGSIYSNKVIAAPIDRDGMVEKFANVATLDLGRAHVHQTPVYGRFIYSLGGKLQSDTSTTTVEIGTFSPP